MKLYLPRSVHSSSFMATFKQRVADCPEFISHKRQANFIYVSFKFNVCMLIAAWHCPFNGAAPASLLRYGYAIAAIPAMPEPNRLRRLM